MSTALSGIGRPDPRKRGFAISTRFIGGYWLVLFFVLLITGLFAVHGGRVVNVMYPLLGTALGVLLFAYRRGVYVAFVWWVWMFTPEVRRLADYQSGYHQISPIMVTPLLVTMIAGTVILSRPRFLLRRSILPFSLFGAALMYGLCVGIVANGIAAAIYDFANWAIPLAFAIYLLQDVRRFAENRAALLNAMIIGLLGTSLYGLYQFYQFPPWDQYWLDHAKIASAGPGIAEQVRLFGPLNSSGPYGIALLAPLVFAQAMRGPLKIVTSVFGYPAFGLSLVRSAWGGWALAMVYLIGRVGGKMRLRVIVWGSVIALLAYPLVSVGPVADALSARFATFSDIQNDGSFQARQSLYETFTVTAFSDPIGIGLGGNGLATRLGSQVVQGFDSGVLDIPFVFGWLGGVMMICSLTLLVARCIAGSSVEADYVALAATGVVFAMLFQNIFGPSFNGVSGLVLWSAAALAYQKSLLR